MQPTSRVKAVSMPTSLVEKDPARLDGWYQLGLLALRQGRHQAVIDYMGKAIALDPSQAPIHHYLAGSYQALLMVLGAAPAGATAARQLPPGSYQVLPRRRRTPTSFEYRPPPLHVTLPAAELPCAPAAARRR